MLRRLSNLVVAHLTAAHLLSPVLEELGGLLVLLRLVGCGSATACTPLLDAAEENDQSTDDDDTDNRGDDGDLSALGESVPSVADSGRLLVLLNGLGFAPGVSLVPLTNGGFEIHTQ